VHGTQNCAPWSRPVGFLYSFQFECIYLLLHDATPRCTTRTISTWKWAPTYPEIDRKYDHTLRRPPLCDNNICRENSPQNKYKTIKSCHFYCFKLLAVLFVFTLYSFVWVYWCLLSKLREININLLYVYPLVHYERKKNHIDVVHQS